MSTTTSNLGLFKYNTITDGNVAFNIDVALNNNWDLLDTYLGNISSQIDFSNYYTKSEIDTMMANTSAGITVIYST